MRIILPIPPSVNSYWRSVPVKNGQASKVLISKEGRAWKKKALQLAAMQRPESFEGDVSISVVVYFANRRRDLDNVMKPLGDLLQAAGILANDRQVARLEMVRQYDTGNPRVEIEVIACRAEAA